MGTEMGCRGYRAIKIVLIVYDKRIRKLKRWKEEYELCIAPTARKAGQGDGGDVPCKQLKMEIGWNMCKGGNRRTAP